MKSARLPFLIVVCLLAGAGSAALRADVLRWWRFEQPDIWTEEIGGEERAIPSAGVGAVTLSSGGLGSRFDRLAAGIPNAGALGLTGRASGVEVTLPELGDRFTLECLFTPLDPAGREREVLFGQGSADGGATESGITVERRFGAAADTAGEQVVPGELLLTLSGGGRFTVVGSGLVPEAGFDYHLAVSFDQAAGEAVFRLRNLDADGETIAVRRRVTVSALNGMPRLMIGNAAPGADAAFRGLIDEVRVADSVLTPEQLLVGPGDGEEGPVAALQARVGQLEALVLQLADELAGLRRNAVRNGEEIAELTNVAELLSQEQGSLGRQVEGLEARIDPLAEAQAALDLRFDEIVGEFSDAIVVLEFKMMGQQELAEHLAGEVRALRETLARGREEWAARFGELESFQSVALFAQEDLENQMDQLAAGQALQLTTFEDVLIGFAERLDVLEAWLDRREE